MALQQKRKRRPEGSPIFVASFDIFELVAATGVEHAR